VVSQEIINMITDAQHACDATVAILNDMLSYEAMEAGKYTIFPELLPAVSTISTIINNIKSIGKDKGIDIKLEVKLTQEESSSVHLCIDSVKIEQVFRNLATNSVKFSASGSEIRIIISRLREKTSAGNGDVDDHHDSNDQHHHHNGDDDDAFTYEPLTEMSNNETFNNEYIFTGALTIRFADDGIGISPENIARVFGEFNQFDPNKLQGGGGAGLGLHISRNIVRCHHGFIRAHSDGVGRGTYFVISLAAFERVERHHRHHQKLPF
jgi:signal transduction histidine kinase